MIELPSHALLGTLVIAIAIFLVQAFFIWRQKAAPAILRPLSYLSYAIVALVGSLVLMQFSEAFGYAQVAPAILFFVAVSSTLKAQRSEATLIQRKAGVVIAAFAYMGIISLL